MTDLFGVVPLDLAVLCEDCHLISAVRRDNRRQCPKCASEALSDLEPVLEPVDMRERNDAPEGVYAGACWNELMTNESKESLARRYMDELAINRILRGHLRRADQAGETFPDGYRSEEVKESTNA